MEPKLKWLQWANELQAIAQSGLTYSKDKFDLLRFKRLNEIAAEIIAEHSTHDFDKILNLFLAEDHYLTPKLDVRVAIIKDQTQILLVKEIADNKWSLPGGWADVNESPSECAKKEVFEETGYSVEITKLYALMDKRKHGYPPQLPHTYKCFFLGHIIGGEMTPSIETSEIRFFDKSELPELSSHRIMPAQIELAFQHHYDPKLSTHFD